MAVPLVAAFETTAQGEEYLEAICRIADRGEVATPTELARELSVAPPSVLGMLRRLQHQGFVHYARKTGAVLTASGMACADRLRRRHRLAECLLTDLLGMPWARAHEVACRFEHVIDDEVEGYLLEALHHPATCPHGNPVGGDPDAWPALATLEPGQTGILRCITDESVPLLDYLTALRLTPGARVTVRACAPFDGPLMLEVEQRLHAVSREVAARLKVEIKGGAR